MRIELSLFGVLVLALDLVAIFSVLMGTSRPSRKVLWTFTILVLPMLGMILYYVFGRSSQDR